MLNDAIALLPASGSSSKVVIPMTEARQRMLYSRDQVPARLLGLVQARCLTQT